MVVAVMAPYWKARREMEGRDERKGSVGLSDTRRIVAGRTDCNRRDIGRHSDATTRMEALIYGVAVTLNAAETEAPGANMTVGGTTKSGVLELVATVMDVVPAVAPTRVYAQGQDVPASNSRVPVEFIQAVAGAVREAQSGTDGQVTTMLALATFWTCRTAVRVCGSGVPPVVWPATVWP